MDAMRSKPSRRDIAYALFLPAGLLELLSGLASLVPMDSGTAGGVGILVLVPLAMVSLVTALIGLVRSVPFWRRDPILMLLAIATALMMVQLFAELGPVLLQKVLALAYGLIVMLIEAHWFLARRRNAG